MSLIQKAFFKSVALKAAIVTFSEAGALVKVFFLLVNTLKEDKSLQNGKMQMANALSNSEIILAG